MDVKNKRKQGKVIWGSPGGKNSMGDPAKNKVLPANPFKVPISGQIFPSDELPGEERIEN